MRWRRRDETEIERDVGHVVKFNLQDGFHGTESEG